MLRPYGLASYLRTGALKLGRMLILIYFCVGDEVLWVEQITTRAGSWTSSFLSSAAIIMLPQGIIIDVDVCEVACPL